MKENEDSSQYTVIVLSGRIGLELEYNADLDRCYITDIMKDAQESIKKKVRLGDILLKWNGKKITTKMFYKIYKKKKQEQKWIIISLYV